jgi:2-polyprenyl-6-methoxyphenol hydroxylase-like FAD-dependent oxidoreductase
LKDEDAKVLLDADPASFGQSLTEIALAPFGMMVLASDRRGWSLRLRHAIRPYAQRLVLLGDAAHAIHPLAGQGFNLAVGDMIGLADALEWGDDHGCEPGDASVLARYARGRVTETAAMTMATDGLNALFSFSPAPLRSLAGAAMTILDQSPLKNIALNFANGTLTRGLFSRRG